MTQQPIARKIRRDTILFLFGLGGLTYQLVTGQVNTALVIVCALMAGVPGAAGLVSLIAGTTTTGSGSASPPSSSPPFSSPGSPTTTGAEHAP